MFDRSRNLIFVHIQKTGGTSIRLALGGERHAREKHFFAPQLRDLYGEKAWDRAYRFSFVRNPWDRLVSWWSMIERARPSLAAGGATPFQRWVLSRATTFGDFLTRCDEDFRDADGSKWIFRNQIDYISDADGRLMVDRVGRFENLSGDFTEILVEARANRKLRWLPVVGWNAKLPPGRTSQRPDYAALYTPTLRDLVGERYVRDIDAFGYAFEPAAGAVHKGSAA